MTVVSLFLCLTFVFEYFTPLTCKKHTTREDGRGGKLLILLRRVYALIGKFPTRVIGVQKTIDEKIMKKCPCRNGTVIYSSGLRLVGRDPFLGYVSFKIGSQ